MRCAVSGANGFIGRNLIDHLKDDGHEVYPLSRETLTDHHRLIKFMWDIDPNRVYHLSAYGNHSTQDNFRDTIISNHSHLINLFESLGQCTELKAFVNFSTSSVYGKRTELKPMSEYDVVNPETLYAITKSHGEHLCRYYAKKHNLPMVTIRPFSVYGEYEAQHRFIPTVCHALNAGIPITLAPHAMHDWVYIHDFLNGVDVCINNIDKLQGDVVNIGTGKEHTNREVVSILEKISKRTLEKDIVKSMRDYDGEHWFANIAKIHSMGWKPLYTLEEGLTNTYESYKN